MYKNLGAFLRALEAAGELRRVTTPVSPRIDISRHTDRESKSPGGGKALFFEKVIGSEFPVTTNIFGSSRRIGMALGVDRLDDLGERVRRFVEMDPPHTLRDALKALPMAAEASRFMPRVTRSRRPPCQEVVLTGDAVDLSRLPVLTCWPKDGGPFVTLPLVFTRSPVTGRRNVGMYRLQVYDRNTTGMHWHIHKDGSHYYSEYRAAKRRMPVSVAIGADPATTYAATAPLPRGIDEMILAGFIRKSPVVLAKCLTNDLEVPAEAEFVLEGYVDPDEMRLEGPFGDHTGYYSLADHYPVFHVTAITHRRNPVYGATLVGPPPMEDCYLAKATERLFLPLLRTIFPEVRDYWLPWEGVFHNIVVVSIDKAYAGHAQRIMSGFWGQGQMSFCKAIVVIDGHLSPQNPADVWNAFLSRFDPSTDVTITTGVLDVLDHSSPHANFGYKIGLDLTARMGGEPPRQDPARRPPVPARETVAAALERAVPGLAAWRHLSPETAERPDVRNRVLALAVERREGLTGKVLADRILAEEDLSGFTVIGIFDAHIDVNDGSRMLWKLFNNTDPGRDLILRDGRAVVDARIKGPMDGHHREWPEELTFDV